MKFLEEHEYRELASEEYYNPNAADRWPYLSLCIDVIKSNGWEKVLEIGPYNTPLAKACDVMDIDANRLPTDSIWHPKPETRSIIHDASVTPWPIATKAYDVVVGLQVWEHLEGGQKRAFHECHRVAKYALLSFPFEWKCRNAKHCRNVHCEVDDSVIKYWTAGWPVKESWIIQEEAGLFHKRRINLYEFGGEA